MEERGIRKVKLTSEMKNSFMQYAMSYKKNGKNILNYIPLKQ